METTHRVTFIVTLVFVFLFASCQHAAIPDTPARPEPVSGAHHIVALGDPHYPGKFPEVKEAKDAVIATINEWPDVELVAVVGDLCETVGTPAEYKAIGTFMGNLNKKPKALIVGNHDYFYNDVLAGGSDPDPAPPLIKAAKLERFKSTFGMDSLYYSKTLGNYLLIFLSTDNLSSDYFAAMSTGQIDWFSSELTKNRNTPTVVFFHAPLKGTLDNNNKPKFFAQPDGEIEAILKENPQVFLWLSGHVHPATLQYGDKLYLDRVREVSLPDLERWEIRTTSLYLHPDRVVIRAWNHHKGAWEPDKDATIMRPVL
jgi:hypothetical protein